MYIDKIIKKEVTTLLISVGLLLIIFIGVSFASFFKIDEGKDNIVETGDLNISFCTDSTCDNTYQNIGQVIGTTKQNGESVPASIYPYPNDGTYSNGTPYIFKVENTGTMPSTITIKLNEDTDFLPTGNYQEYQRLTNLYSSHLKVAIRKKVLASGSEYQMGDVNMDGIVNYDDVTLVAEIASYDTTPTDEQIKLGDIDGSGEVDADDLDYLVSSIKGEASLMPNKTNIMTYNEISNNIILTGDVIEAGETATYFLWLYLDETTPNQAQKTYFVGNLDIEGEYLPENLPFSSQSWSQIISNVKAGNTSEYNVGDTKEVDLGTYGKHTLRIANMSTPSECSTSGFSQTACGFVLEFEDIISEHEMNPEGEYNGTQYAFGHNIGGWPNTTMRTFINNDIYNLLPADLKDGIINTTVVSSHGNNDSTNFTSKDKLYLLAPPEIYSDWNEDYDTAKDLTRQLDYYNKEGVSITNYSKASKNYNSNSGFWWLRSAYSSSFNNFIFIAGGGYIYDTASNAYGVSPAFRIG